MKTLIVVPTAKMSNTPEWMYTFDRNYDILHINYSDEHMLAHSSNRHYMLMNFKGQKWSIVDQLLNDPFVYELFQEYDYVGFWDDDLIANANDIDNSIIVAASVKAKMWQMSLSKDSDCSYPVLVQNPAASLYKTNFIEIMAPFYHTSLLPRMKEFFSMYEVSTGWGFDVIGSSLFETAPVVIHHYSITHPYRENGSLYDKTAAVKEQEICYKKYENIRQQYGLASIPDSIKVTHVF